MLWFHPKLMPEITHVYTCTETPISWRSTEEVFYSDTVQHWQYRIHTWLACLWMLFSRRVETTHAEMRCSVLVVAVVTIDMCFWQYHRAWRSLLCFVLIRSTWCDYHSLYCHGPHLHCCGGDDPPRPAVLLSPVSTRPVPDYNYTHLIQHKCHNCVFLCHLINTLRWITNI